MNSVSFSFFTKVPYGRDNQNQASVTSAKYNMFRAFTENLKEVIIFENNDYMDVTNNICNQVWSVTSRMALTV